jgi:nitrogen-specific signal transduction histidine kinase
MKNDPSIPGPLAGLRTTEQLLKANVQVLQLILGELVRIRQLLEKEIDMVTVERDD